MSERPARPTRPVRPGPLAEGRASDPYRVGIDPASPAVPETGPSAWNIANYLTVARLLLVPIFGWFLLSDGGERPVLRWVAFVVFAVAMVTDRVDGDLARSRGLVTNFGKVADPIADKALVTMALVGLSSIGEVPWWVTVVVLVREWGITAMRFWVIRHGVMAAGRGGKLKTLLQTFGIGFFLWPRWTLPAAGFWDALAWGLLGAAVAVTVVTGVDYVVQALRLRRTSERTARKRAARAARQAERRG
ncbi:CDP-diacylglycerol--glycerol-3-phosphate 3-phosphatidyltransferase [Phycicoccus sp. CSK15P-2]|uniref:CDP-diacylglycerol--glycerol-3-phosphate 3-phosphatidyltransferase n=1 Tax=Phycicoccus sp. CSK15P-2 TaxID=2807627 RepID=UPI00194F8012|nr:CDP-diacylglycerol--glycerol-3-phosphate 3-phosphatidyltransferase [Phycicoccus sp. CSK15P-2]MBM6405000.1 CDP-diacylglycerol--glycerol-3-phosphate 3-phosphatidyltransferase [Phycicoccus sp. CSK15P-2]